MSGLRKGGGCLTLLALPFFCLAVFMVLDPQKGATRLQSLMPGLFFGMVLLAPGLILYFVGRKADRDKEFMDSLTNLIRSHDRFTVAEIAMKTGRTELETERLIAQVDHRDTQIDLVFHRPTRQYMHRGRLAQAERVVERCPRCGAPTQREVVFWGEQPLCMYCNAPLLPS